MKKQPPEMGSSTKKRRRVFRLPGVTILIFLLLGAILNVAVAWGCYFWAIDHSTLWVDTKSMEMGYLGQDLVKPIPQSVLDVHDSHSPDDIQEYDNGDLHIGKIGFGFDNYTHSVSSEGIQDGMQFTDRVFATTGTFCGWPMQSISGYSLFTVTNGRGGRAQTSYIGFVETESLLPYLPLWPGFIFNTLFYAVILWLPYQGFFMLRRHRRIRRGRCGQCGYLVAPNIGVPGASPNCPECGTPISPGTGTPAPGSPIPGIGTPELIKPKA